MKDKRGYLKMAKLLELILLICSIYEFSRVKHQLKITDCFLFIYI